MLMTEQNDELARAVSNVADHAKALFKNIALLFHSINVREDSRDADRTLYGGHTASARTVA